MHMGMHMYMHTQVIDEETAHSMGAEHESDVILRLASYSKRTQLTVRMCMHMHAHACTCIRLASYSKRTQLTVRMCMHVHACACMCMHAKRTQLAVAALICILSCIYSHAHVHTYVHAYRWRLSSITFPLAMPTYLLTE